MIKNGTLAVAAWAFGSGLSLGHAAELQWHTFEWAEAEVVPGAGLAKAGIFLPVKINGAECYAQLDTGANGTVIWKNQTNAALPMQDAVVDIAGKSRTVPASALLLAGVRDGTCNTMAIATIGNAFFDDGTLTLDLKGNRFRFTTEALLKGEAKALPFHYTLWQGSKEGGHIIVQIGLPHGLVAEAMLDTGAASFGLSALTQADWNKLTEGVPLRASTSVQAYKVNSWGKQIPCYTTQVPGSMRIGTALSVPRFSVSYCVLDSFKPGKNLIGVLGLRHLNDRVITLDYRSRKWLIGE